VAAAGAGVLEVDVVELAFSEGDDGDDDDDELDDSEPLDEVDDDPLDELLAASRLSVR
jgi:hypothetical protein